MKIGGWQQCSLIDFPNKISAVLFTKGCTFRCPFCHNPGLVLDLKTTPEIPEKEVLEFLKKRQGKLDGVVISGGEPTIHADLPECIRTIKEMGFAIKVDTNGSRPAMVRQLISENLVDYWAMDRKASLSRYHLLAGVSVDTSAIEETAQLIMNSSKDYEFRTTVIRELHSPEEIIQIGKELRGARRLILQQFRPGITLDPSLQYATAYTREEMDNLCSSLKRYVKECFFR
jgi:pyruvate formate lyase activating enzyme